VSGDTSSDVKVGPLPASTVGEPASWVGPVLLHPEEHAATESHARAVAATFVTEKRN
jgi:hypothetical protein